MSDSLSYTTETSLRRLLGRPITRRSLLAGGVSLAALAAAAACGGGTSSAAGIPQVKKSTLIYHRPSGYDANFNTYLAQFSTHYGITATISSLSVNYDTVTATELLGGADYDVLEADGGFLGQWYAAGLVQALDDFPGLAALKADMFPGAITDMTTPDGHFSGLPYFTTHKGFYINAELFDKANLQPPSTWAEVIDVARTLKSRGIATYPLAPVWDNLFNRGTMALGSMAFSEGMNQMFDDKFNPVYEKDPIMLQALKNMVTLYSEKLVPQDCMTNGNASAISNMTQKYSAMYEDTAHNATSLNLPPSPIAGKIKMIPYPGKNHGSWALTAPHLMQKKESDRMDAWNLLSFLSGTDWTGAYTVPLNFYAVKIGIPVPYKSLNQNPALAKALATWVDVPTYQANLSQTVSVGSAINTPWFEPWSSIFVAQMQDAITGATDPQSALTKSADFVRSQIKK